LTKCEPVAVNICH